MNKLIIGTHFNNNTVMHPNKDETTIYYNPVNNPDYIRGLRYDEVHMFSNVQDIIKRDIYVASLIDTGLFFNNPKFILIDAEKYFSEQAFNTKFDDWINK